MTDRGRWQYCQIEVGGNSMGILRQFVADRLPVETNLHQNWPAMLAKLGEQGWELIATFPNEGGKGRSPLTYVLKRPLPSGASSSAPIQGVQQTAAQQPQDQKPPQPQPPEPQQFDPLDFP